MTDVRARKWVECNQQNTANNHNEVYIICVRSLFQKIPEDTWSKVCVVFDMGRYVVYVNAQNSGNAFADPVPVNSHSDATLGFVEGRDPMKGYFDDVRLCCNGQNNIV